MEDTPCFSPCVLKADSPCCGSAYTGSLSKRRTLGLSDSPHHARLLPCEGTEHPLEAMLVCPGAEEQCRPLLRQAQIQGGSGAVGTAHGPYVNTGEMLSSAGGGGGSCQSGEVWALLVCRVGVGGGRGRGWELWVSSSGPASWPLPASSSALLHVATPPRDSPPLPLWPPAPPWLCPPAPLWLPFPVAVLPLPPGHPIPSPIPVHPPNPATCPSFLSPAPAHISLSPQGTDSESEDAPPQHSFVNHYMSDPTYYNSWKRRAPGGRAPHRYEAVAGSEAGPHLHTVVTTQSAVFAPTGPGARTPLTGFSSFV